MTALGVLCCFALFVCLFDLACFFLPSSLICICTCTYTYRGVSNDGRLKRAKVGGAQLVHLTHSLWANLLLKQTHWTQPGGQRSQIKPTTHIHVCMHVHVHVHISYTRELYVHMIAAKHCKWVYNKVECEKNSTLNMKLEIYMYMKNHVCSTPHSKKEREK